MKKVFLVIVAQFVFITNLFAQNSNQALIFAVDVSRSMLNPQGFYESLKGEIKEYIKRNVQINDLVTIYSFGDDVKIVSDVPNYRINGVQDIEKLIGFIDKFEPTDSKTWLSKAFDNVATQMSSTQSQFPQIPIKAFIFTDGRNDPPTMGGSLSMEEILTKHNAVFENPNTHTFIISLDTEIDSEIKKLEDKNRNVQILRGSKSLSIKELLFMPSYQKLVLISTEEKKISAGFKLLSVKNITSSDLKFILQNKSEVKVKPADIDISISDKIAGFEIPIEVLGEVNIGKYKLFYKVVPSDNAISVTPKEVVIELVIEGDLVNITTSQVEVKSTTKGGVINIPLKGENRSKNQIRLLPIIEPSTGDLTFEKDFVTIPPGAFEQNLNFQLQPKEKGQYSYMLSFKSLEGDVFIDKNIGVNLQISKPYNWGPLLNILGFILIVIIFIGVAFTALYLINNAFAAYTISGMGINNLPLNDFKKFYSIKLTIGRDIFSDLINEEIVTIKASIKTVFDRNLKLEWYNQDKIIPTSLIEHDTLEPMKVNYDKKYNFEIQRNINN
jgi:hypothetical protein